MSETLHTLSLQADVLDRTLSVMHGVLGGKKAGEAHQESFLHDFIKSLKGDDIQRVQKKLDEDADSGLALLLEIASDRQMERGDLHRTVRREIVSSDGTSQTTRYVLGLVKNQGQVRDPGFQPEYGLEVTCTNGSKPSFKRLGLLRQHFAFNHIEKIERTQREHIKRK